MSVCARVCVRVCVCVRARPAAALADAAVGLADAEDVLQPDLATQRSDIKI